MSYKGLAGFAGLCLAVCAVTPLYATGSDVAKEQRWAEQVIDGLLDGDELWLDDGQGHQFLGIYTEAEGASKNAVVLVHGIGVHPDWPDVIFPLREGLLAEGTTSLSLQMPVLANDAEARAYLPLFEEAPKRLEAGVDYLREQGYRRIVIVAHSLGAAMSTYYLSIAETHEVASLVIIGMNPGISELRNLRALEKVSVAVLDLYGSEDLPGVLNFVRDRARAGQQGGKPNFTQVRVEGANHFFQGHESELLKLVVDWIETPH